MHSVHTPSFPGILDALQASVIVSTYQAGKLILLRNENGTLNTHFRNFQQPMGVALHDGRLAVGTLHEIWEFHNTPAVAQRLPSEPCRTDACYLPRSCDVTGDIQIHEMDYDRDLELWFVNTRFSCLATRSREYNFVPRWKPGFISGYTPEDRCHLNGLAMADGRPKYVTALGETDTPAGWRENKASGGVVMDVESGEIISRGLSMPHSPRVHQDRLWVLNSGDGGFGSVDLKTGRYEPVLELPGFTRGLSFLGRFAFIGLSQVRESAVFSGIRIAQMEETERWAGVAIVDIEKGDLAGFLKFQQDVHEVFAVCVLPGAVWPDVINHDADLIGQSYVLPDDALAQVPPEFRTRS